MQFFAHSGKEIDKSDWQTLIEHSESVARLAAQMASTFGCENAAYAAGLFHDLGKYNPAFQKRLEGVNVHVDHSTSGAALLPLLTQGQNRGISHLIAYVIAGHHAGLPDMTNGSGSLSERVKKYEYKLDGVWKDELKFELEELVPATFKFSEIPERRPFQFSLLGRMIFSCLVDADYKDTEAFYDKLENRKRDREWQPLQELLPQFKGVFDSKMNEMSKTDTEVNRMRTDILSHVRVQAAQKPGLFTLTVPTGGGKTLASLGFALDHAKIHGHNRIIFAIPFTSIIDQTAKIFSELLGAEHILEHHSAIDTVESGKGQHRDWRDKLKLAMEDWAAPIVVTTNVQFFESLFASRTSASRKLHNIANSVIILDEAQTIPRNLLSPLTQGRGSKLLPSARGPISALSPLTQGRGSKPVPPRAASIWPGRPSHRGVDRNVLQSTQIILPLIVAPHTGAWIETRRINLPHHEMAVAPHTGAWIETSQSPTQPSSSPCRPSHRGVDRNTNKSTKTGKIRWSPLTQGRGSKLRHAPQDCEHSLSPLTQGRGSKLRCPLG